MTKAKNVIALAVASALTGSALTAQAATYTWTAGPGTGVNWSTGFGGTYPNAAADQAIIGPLAGNLTTNIDVTNSTMGMLTFGSGGFTTDIGNNNNTGNGLVFNNTGGTGNSQIITTAGTNTISAPIILGGNVEFGSSSLTSLAIGSVTVSGGARQLSNNATNQTLTINGTIFTNVLSTPNVTAGLTINGSGNATINNGNVVINGAFNANGAPASISGVVLGTGSTVNNLVRSTITLNADNSAFIGNITLSRANTVLTNDNNLGTGRLLLGGATNSIDAFVSATSTRTIGSLVTPTQLQIQQFNAFTGTNSFIVNSRVLASASRGMGNLLSGGATLTLNSGFYSANTVGDARNQIIDGSGTTIINGGLHNGYDQTNNIEFVGAAAGSYEKRGTGLLQINGTSTYLGGTRVRGGLMEFGTSAAYGVGSATAGNGITVDAGGAVGLATGSLDSAFLARIALGGGSNFSTVNAGDTAVTTNTTTFPSNGALALTNNDTNIAINYGGGGNLSAPFLQTIGLGAVSTGASYAGTITPAASTYRLGGGGTLTLTNPGGNQLTGANSVVANNGGTVAINGTNNYTGTTSIGGSYINPTQELLRLGQTINVPTNFVSLRANSTVSVNSLANGGSPSGIGSSSNAASNLVINGGTLQYTGAGSSTDRLMTVTSNGANLDASGSGAVNFTNTGAVLMQDPAGRGGVVDTTTKTILYVNDPSDLTVGMTITGTGLAAGTTIRAIIPPSFSNIGGTTGVGPYQIILSAAATTTGYAGVPDLAFGNANRTLGFAGTSTAANTFGGAIANSAGGGTVSISKTGAGTWALAGSNTYTGNTSVTAGTLQVNTVASLPGTSAITVGGAGSTATLKIGGPITLNLSALTLAANGRFDVGNGTLNNTTSGGGATALAAAKALVVSGYNGGAWNGPGYISSSADATHGVGYKDTGTGIQYRYTLYGDADLDGGVSINDFNALSANFGQASGKFWVDGDFDYDGGVSINDFNLLAGGFGQSVPANSEMWAGLLAFAEAHNDLAAFQAVTGVPEPTSLGLLAAGATLGLRRRRRA